MRVTQFNPFEFILQSSWFVLASHTHSRMFLQSLASLLIEAAKGPYYNIYSGLLIILELPYLFGMENSPPGYPLFVITYKSWESSSCTFVMIVASPPTKLWRAPAPRLGMAGSFQRRPPTWISQQSKTATPRSPVLRNKSHEKLNIANKHAGIPQTCLRGTQQQSLRARPRCAERAAPTAKYVDEHGLLGSEYFL